MDENKKRTDDQKVETQIPGEKISGDLAQSTEIGGKGEKKELNAIEVSHNHKEIRQPFESENGEVKPDATAMQDLFKAMGIHFWKTKKKAASISDNNEINAVNTSQADKTRLDKDFIQNALNENLEERAKEPLKKIFKRKLLIIPALIILPFLGYLLYGFIMEPRPPSENVVASYGGKNLTSDDLMAYIKSRGYKEEEHGLCKKHGFDHSKCDKTEECETHPIHSMEAYRQIVKMMAVQNIVEDWAKEKGITQKDEVKHDFKHLVEEVSLDNLVDKVHKDQLSPEKIDKWEVQNYYDANKDKYKDKSLTEVEGEIRNILAAEKDKQFFPEYIEKLKMNAALNVHYDILKVGGPTETEMRIFFERNKGKYFESESAKILEIKVDISGSEEEARKKADEAMTKIKGGGSFEDVAKRYSSSKQVDAYYVKQGEKGLVFEDKVFNLQVNEISPVFKDGNSFNIVKIVEKREKREKTFSAALNEIRAEVLKEKEQKQYELKKNEALFSIHGKRFTLGEFNEEFKELSPETQTIFAGFEAKRSLIDQLIAKELLLEESGDDSADKESSEVIEELKGQYISQILHKEEVDEKMGEITDEEASKFYEQKKEYFIDPPKAQISLIRVEQGASDAEKTRARQKIDEVLQKLKGGADFAALAKEFSNDPTAPLGGELNEWLYDDSRLDPLLAKSIFKLQPDEVSSLFEYEGGYYVVKLRQKEDKRQRTFEEVKEQIKESLLDEKHHKKEAELEDELLKKSQLVIYDSSLRKMLKEQTKTKN